MEKAVDVSRRSFLQGSAAGIAGAALAGAAVSEAFADEANAEAEEETVEVEAEEEAEGSADSGEKDIVATYECDICVVGAGFSGMIAAVEAAEDGANVLIVEASDTTGGSGANGLEGSFGANSSMQQELGLEVDIHEVLMDEMEQSQWRADGLAWLEMLENSGENIDWLIDHGVKFSTVDNYSNKNYDAFHWYENGIVEGYIDPMTAQLDELGIQVEYSTKAEELIIQDGTVAGVYATNADGEWIEVDAKATILATGGFAANYDLASNIGYQPDEILCVGSSYDDGSGHNMAIAAGAKDMSMYACDNCCSFINSWGFSMTGMYFTNAPQVPWINEDCERFYKEDNCVVNFPLANPPKWNQQHAYMIWDQGIWDDYIAGQEDEFESMLQTGLEANAGDMFQADTISELAEAAGLDPDALEAFVEDYNAMCAAGEDTLWGKDAEYMVALENPPYYLAEPIFALFTTIGSVATNRNGQAITSELAPIDGLYVVGVEGCMLYRNVYTIGTPGSCSGNSINMARTAAKHAVENYL